MANKPIVYENPSDTRAHSIAVEGLRPACRGVTANAVTSLYRTRDFRATYYVRRIEKKNYVFIKSPSKVRRPRGRVTRNTIRRTAADFCSVARTFIAFPTCT